METKDTSTSTGTNTDTNTDTSSDTDTNLHQQPADAQYTFEFNGKAGEYFRIWIVNLLLTIVTLGIYSAWAKVRDQRYINGSTVLAGSSFEYTAEPKRILIGRIIGLVIFGIYNVIGTFYPTFAFVALAAIMCFIPAAIVLSMQFRHRNTVWRGIRFSFAGNFKAAYKVFSPFIVIAIILAVIPFVVDLSSFMGENEEAQTAAQIACLENNSGPEDASECINPDASSANPADFEFPSHLQWALYAFGALYFIALLAFPWWQTIYYRFLADNSNYGQSNFSLPISSWPFYKMYLVALALIVIAIILSSIFGGVFGALGIFLFSAAFIFANAYITTTKTNILYSNLSIEGVHFTSTLSTSKMLWLYISNTFAIILSLGLLIPWARVRTLKYRASETRVYSVELDNFVNRQVDDENALGEEVGEVFGLDIGI